MDLRESGEMCSRHRALRLMQGEGMRAEVGYGGKTRYCVINAVPDRMAGFDGSADNYIVKPFPQSQQLPRKARGGSTPASCCGESSSPTVTRGDFLPPIDRAPVLDWSSDALAVTRKR